MPVLFQISIEVNSGSVGRIAEQIGQTVISHGWESYITYARNHLPSSSKTIKIGTKWDVYWHGIMTRLFDTHCFHSTRATKNLIKQIENIKPDIIQLHHIHGYFLNMQILFDYLSSISIPIVWVFHDCWAMTGHCAYFDYIGCNKWRTQCYKCIQKRCYPQTWLFDRSKKNYLQKKKLFTSVDNLTIISVSKWLDTIVGHSFLNRIKRGIIYNGIDVNLFKPYDIRRIREKFLIHDKFMILGVASTWDKRKGLESFIRFNTLIDKTFVLVLVGLNKKQIEELPHGIIGLERTENIQELAELYSAADVHISFSVEETFGLTVVESMSCGTPVIVYNATALPELVTQETGYVVEVDNIEEAYKATLKIKEVGKAHFSVACRNRVVNHFNMEERFEDYMRLYNKLLFGENILK